MPRSAIRQLPITIGAILQPMLERHLSPIDRLIGGMDHALRTLAAGGTAAARPNPASAVKENPLTRREAAHSAGLMRVNHAGEIAAQGLYQGHAAVARNKDIEEQMTEAADEELDHLEWCRQRLAELNSRPSRLSRPSTTAPGAGAAQGRPPRSAPPRPG